MSRWLVACSTEDVDAEDVIPADVEGVHLAIYRSPEGAFFATEGFCTHERFLLTDGLVMGSVIECPKHNGRFDYTAGRGLGAPICRDLRTFPVRIVDGRVEVEID